MTSIRFILCFVSAVFWGDGGGFSRNPRLSLASLRPDFRDVSLEVGEGLAVANVVLNYRFGLSVRPVRS